MEMNGICRFCLKDLAYFDKFYEINDEVKQDFFNITQNELVLSVVQNNLICELCLRSLQLASAVKLQFLENQKKFFMDEQIDDYQDMVNMEPKIKEEAGESLHFGDIKYTNAFEPQAAQNKSLKPEVVKSNLKILEKDKVQCPICQKFYSSIKTMREHMGIHYRTGNEEFNCDECGKSFIRIKTLRRHKQRHDKTYLKECVKCSKCGRKFRTETSLRAHLKEHREHCLNKFQCDLCGREFPKKFSLIYHISCRHLREQRKIIYCPYCPKNFKDISQLSQHVQISHDNKRFICGYPLCDKEFNKKEKCRAHFKKFHPEIQQNFIDGLIREELKKL